MGAASIPIKGVEKQGYNLRGEEGKLNGRASGQVELNPKEESGLTELKGKRMKETNVEDGKTSSAHGKKRAQVLVQRGWK